MATCSCILSFLTDLSLNELQSRFWGDPVASHASDAPSSLHVHVFAQTAGVTFVWPPARALCLVLLLIPTLVPEQILGISSRLPRFEPDFHICRCMSLPTFMWPPARAFCLVSQIHFTSALKQILERSSRLPCLGPDFHNCRCMFLPRQPESFFHILFSQYDSDCRAQE